MRRLAAIVGCSIALSAAMPAFADDVAGDWLFDTSKFADDCQISGRITFTQTSVKNTYNCVFESEQICGKLNFDLYIRVQQNCTAQRIGKGLSDIELGLRMRYEVRREFAPYVGITYSRKIGASADLARAAGDDAGETGVVVGIRAWF